MRATMAVVCCEESHGEQTVATRVTAGRQSRVASSPDRHSQVPGRGGRAANRLSGGEGRTAPPVILSTFLPPATTPPTRLQLTTPTLRPTRDHDHGPAGTIRPVRRR